MVERRIRAARFPAVKSLDTFDFPAIPSLIGTGDGTGPLRIHPAPGERQPGGCRRQQRHRQDPRGPGDWVWPPASEGYPWASPRHSLVRVRGGQETEGCTICSQLITAESADHRRTAGSSHCPGPDRNCSEVFSQRYEWGSIDGDHQPTLRPSGPRSSLGAPHRSAAGPAHPPRPHPGDERRELPPQAQPGERCSTSPRTTWTTHKSMPEAVLTHSLTQPAASLPL